jgi:hypothetical protein
MVRQPSPIIPINPIFITNGSTVTTTQSPEDADFFILPVEQNIKIVDNNSYFNFKIYESRSDEFVKISDINPTSTFSCNRYKIYLTGDDLNLFAIINNDLYFDIANAQVKQYTIKIVLSDFNYTNKIEKTFTLNVSEEICQ